MTYAPLLSFMQLQDNFKSLSKKVEFFKREAAHVVCQHGLRQTDELITVLMQQRNSLQHRGSPEFQEIHKMSAPKEVNSKGRLE